MENKNTIGQRLVWTLDLPREFKQKQQDGTEVDLQRLYQLVLPYGAPFEEIYPVLEDMLAEVKRLEVISKEAVAKAQAENARVQAEKEAMVDIEEASTN
jgi:hypothetical protein